MSSTQRGYPLGALFVLIAACAVLVAGIAPLVRLFAKGETEGLDFLVGGIVAGVGCGFLVGTVLGLLQFRRGLGIVMGAGAGTLIGGAAGGIALLPAGQMLAAAIAMTAGSSLVVGVAVLMRRVETEKADS